MEIKDNYVFFFVGGSCGSFVKCIFYYYLYKLKRYDKPVYFKIDPITGHCHENNVPQHYHWINDLDQTKKLILIDFDQDDKSTIAKMAFYKHFKFSIYKNPDILNQNWYGKLSNIDPLDIELLEKTFVQNPNYLIFLNWRNQVKKLNPVLVIKFKDILYGQLNEIIANYLQTVPLPEVENYIKEYRAINKKYIDIAQ